MAAIGIGAPSPHDNNGRKPNHQFWPISDRRLSGGQTGKAAVRAILHWHVDDMEASFERLLELDAREYDPITKRGETGFVTASVVDPFGNILGIMFNPHYLRMATSDR